MADKDTAMRVMKAATATALAAYGFKKGGLVGKAIGIVGAGLGATEIAAVAGVPLAQSAPREVRESIDVMASPEKAYHFWSRFEDFPSFMSKVIDVRQTSAKTWRWTVEGPLGQPVEWDARVIADVPGKLIAWRSTTAGMANRAEVRFERTANGTRVLVFMRNALPAGPLGAIVAWLTKGDPGMRVQQDLRRFKQQIEAGDGARAAQRDHLEEAELHEAAMP